MSHHFHIHDDTQVSAPGLLVVALASRDEVDTNPNEGVSIRIKVIWEIVIGYDELEGWCTTCDI